MCLPATYYVLLLPFPRASAICVCAKSDARCPSTSLVLLFPSLPCAPYTTFPHALTLSPLLNVGRGPAPWPDKQLRACQSCLPGAQRLIRVAPISHLLCGLLALSSASLHRLVLQSTRNMIDWLGFLFPCAFLYTTNSPVACGVRVCIHATQVCPPLIMSFSCLPTSFCHLCLRKVSCALASMCAVYNIPSRTHTEPAPQCRTWPSTLAVRGCVQLVQVLQAFLSAPHLATPTNFFLCLAFSGPLSSPHAYATRACPTLGWPLPSYKPGSPRALTCSPLRACQSCLPGAWCVFLLPSPQACALCIHPTSYSCRPNFTLTLRSPRVAATRSYRLLALSSAPFLYSRNLPGTWLIG